MTAARGFRFDPGRYGGKPVSVEITFTQKFLPRARPPAPDAPTAPKRRKAPRSRRCCAAASSSSARAARSRPRPSSPLVGDQHYRTESDASGHFRLPLPPGAARVSVFASGAQHLRPAGDARGRARAGGDLPDRARTLQPRTRPSSSPSGGATRSRASRCAGDEIQKMPGTFGDPFRVIQTLPGVASVVSLLPFPIVRGASPSSTGFLLDGTRIPLLFHLLAGPSVVHPVFIDEIQFFPGGAPAPYGGYVGGIVDGRTRRARPDERLLDFDVNLLQAGGFVRAPVTPLGATVTAAGRYGYPGYPAGPRDQRGVALVLGLPAAARRRYARQQLDGLRLRRARPARHAGAHGDAERSQPAARAVADPRLSPPGPAPQPDAGAARRDVPRRARLRPHAEQRHRLLGVDRRAADRRDVDPEQQAAHRRRRARHVPQPPAGRDGAADRQPVRRDHVVARDDLRRVVVPGDDLAADARRARSGPACAPTSMRTRRPPSPPSIRASRCATACSSANLPESEPTGRRARRLAEGERRHLPPAAAVRPPAARPRPDAAQVRPPALVPDQRRRRDAAAREDLALGRGLLQLHGPDDLRSVVQPGVGGDRPQPHDPADQHRHAR